MRLGIDFGSTYSTVSRYVSSSDTIEALTLMEGESASVPSVVSISKGKGMMTYGNSAKNKIGRDAFRIYDAFKMLLVEPDQQILKKKGYTEERTPRFIAKSYLEYLLTGVVNRYAQDGEGVEEVVICVPEVWSSRVRTLDGRNILREILKDEIELPGGCGVEHIKVVTEPEAASAFFAHNYERDTNKKFNGHILLIDYGGGTLDITLTQVYSDGEHSMEIGYRESGGAGENHPDSEGNFMVGNAGFAYMQQVTALAIRESGILDEEEEPLDFTSSDFTAAMHELEGLIKDPQSVSQIEFTFGSFGDYSNFSDILDDPAGDEVLGIICFADEEINVTLKHLYIAYRDIIEGVLAKEIEDIAVKTMKHIDNRDPRSIESGMRDDFKIALVGGFGSFYLVRKQIAEIFNLDSNDLRVKNIDLAKSEQAIALGAGLLASGRVVLQKTARFSIGLYSRGTNERNMLSYGIRWHQEVKPGQPYFLLSDNGEDRISNRNNYGALRNNITHFVVEFSPAMNKGVTMALKPVFLQKLSAIPDEGIWNCGFSMDENEVISFHIVPRAGQDPKFKEIVIRLDSYTNLFDLTAGEEVYTDEI